MRMDGRMSEKFMEKKGQRQGDPLSIVPFHLAQEIILRESGIKTEGLIHDNRNQCLVYAYDMVLIERSKKENKIFKLLEGNVNESKTKKGSKRGEFTNVSKIIAENKKIKNVIV